MTLTKATDGTVNLHIWREGEEYLRQKGPIFLKEWNNIVFAARPGPDLPNTRYVDLSIEPIEFPSQTFDAVYSYGSYEGTLRKLVHLFKYTGVRPLARPFGELLARALPRDQRFDLIVPMPLHWFKRWQRGFNQADLLAQEIGRKWQVPVRNVVRRRKATSSQAGLSNAKRRANVQGAFRVARGQALNGLRVLLVDDVLTTGATASACARALKRAGAAHVSLLALARTDRRTAIDQRELLTQGAHA